MSEDLPYTLPEEDPFNVEPVLTQLRRRRSSMLDKWIQEQQLQPLITDRDKLNAANKSCVEFSRSPTNPYLAYPDLRHPSLERETSRDDAITLNSFVLVEDSDFPLGDNAVAKLPSTPNNSRRTSKNILSPSSFRKLNISFRSIPTTTMSEDPSPRSTLRNSLFPRGPRQSIGSTTSNNTQIQHLRSSSMSSVADFSSSPRSKTGTSSKWRPSVLNHFSQASTTQPSSLPSETFSTPSRPSVSSADTQYTHSSATTPTINSYTSAPSRPSFIDSMRSRNRWSQASASRAKPGSISSSSAWSQNQLPYPSPIEPNLKIERTYSSVSSFPPRSPLSSIPGSNLGNLEDIEDDGLSFHSPKYDTVQPPVTYASKRSFSQAAFSSLSSRGHKRKKLVISGVGCHEVRKFEGLKRWCESFGELRQITRIPNGDLHVEFRRADVADTVCRIRARVFISGVGSVQLSWFCEKR